MKPALNLGETEESRHRHNSTQTAGTPTKRRHGHTGNGARWNTMARTTLALTILVQPVDATGQSTAAIGIATAAVATAIATVGGIVANVQEPQTDFQERAAQSHYEALNDDLQIYESDEFWQGDNMTTKDPATGLRLAIQNVQLTQTAHRRRRQRSLPANDAATGSGHRNST